ncbi:MAG: hypothetical protein E5V24_02685 [Mesorhizobium sp.]|nr:MAG: hypothetical protein E5V24_02685 [Mesorhizobium sp.]
MELDLYCVFAFRPTTKMRLSMPNVAKGAEIRRLERVQIECGLVTSRDEPNFSVQLTSTPFPFASGLIAIGHSTGPSAPGNKGGAWLSPQ